jgi:hypothetical protein
MPDISLKSILLMLACVVGLWVLTPVVFYWLPLDMASRGQAGDLFGSINALFSGLAFAGVVFAILLQRQELALQRQELKEARLEMKRTADAQEAAHQALNKTIWAQSYKVAWDILNEPRVIGARKFVVSQRARVVGSRSTWDGTTRESVDLVGRSFDSVGTLIRKGLLPEEYVIDTLSFEIGRHWHLLSSHVADMRAETDDLHMWKDFEGLAASAEKYLRQHDIPV